MNKSNLGGFAISPELYEWMVSNLTGTILELGSGTGSAELANKFIMFCVENDERYIYKYDSINYIYAPLFPFDNKRGKYEWYNLTQLKLPDEYDAILVDGPLIKGKKGFYRHIEMFRKDVPIIINDTQKSEENEMVKLLRLHKYFKDCRIITVKGREKTASILIPKKSIID